MCDKYEMATGLGPMLGAEAGNYRPTIAEVLQKESMNQASRQSFAESLANRIHRAESSAHEVARLRRLAELFDKHPDVREMFELVRDLGVL